MEWESEGIAADDPLVKAAELAQIISRVGEDEYTLIMHYGFRVHRRAVRLRWDDPGSDASTNDP